MSNKWLIGAVSLALMASAANAKDHLEKEHKAGMATGAAMGAAVGGPFGAVFGAIVGAIGGDFVSDKRIADERSAALEDEVRTLEAQLQDAQEQLASLSRRDTEEDPLFAMLAERLHGDILFRTGSAELDPVMEQRIVDLGAVLAQQSLITVDVDGFADPRGKKDSNLQLSEARAIAVRDALVKGGLPADRIRVTAHGESNSTALPGDHEAYAWERRVSLALRASPEGKLAKR